MDTSEKTQKYNQLLIRLQDNLKKDDSMPSCNVPERIPTEKYRPTSASALSLCSHGYNDAALGIGSKPFFTKTLIRNLPKDLRKKASNILKQWSKHTNISVNDYDELMFDGVAIRGGNAVALITKLAADDDRNEPPGYQEMTLAIAKLKLPEHNQTKVAKSRAKLPKRLQQKSHRTIDNKFNHNSRIYHTPSNYNIKPSSNWISLYNKERP